MLSLSIILYSCMPKDIPVKPYDRGNAIIGKAEMGSNYTYQIYYDLSSNKAVSANDYSIWDLAFSCEEDNNYIYLNGGKAEKLHNFGPVNFNSVDEAKVKSLSPLDWSYDKPDGTPDSTAIGKWWITDINGNIISKNYVYVLDRGYNFSGNYQGIIKFSLLGYDKGKFKIKYSNLDGKMESIIEINKILNKNFIMFSFDSGGKTLDLEPKNTDWDILFTRFTELLADNAGNPLWYTVTSTLINTKYVKAALIDSIKPFENITIDDVKPENLTSLRNAIGHTWKSYDFIGTNRYTIYPNKTYVLVDTEGFYYKLHFIDFFNENGLKGYPKFEFKKL